MVDFVKDNVCGPTACVALAYRLPCYLVMVLILLSKYAKSKERETGCDKRASIRTRADEGFGSIDSGPTG